MVRIGLLYNLFISLFNPYMSEFNQFIHQLPYFEESAALFSTLADQPWAIFLDSGHPKCSQGRFDIFSANPWCTLETHAAQTTMTCQRVCITSLENPFTLVKKQLRLFADNTLPEKYQHLPFCGGAMGYFGYDLVRCLESLPEHALDPEHIPEMAIGIYTWAVVIDHQRKETFLVGSHLSSAQQHALITQFSVLPESKKAPSFRLLSSVNANISYQEYAQAFDKIKRYLQEGDCYQVNLTQRFSADCTGDAWEVYQLLRQVNAAPFSCYFNLPKVQILSSSPERFLQLHNGQVQTKPIKGTRPRKDSPEEDQRQIEHLKNSHKDCAENLMIVDLLRNDLSKTCRPGSVKVPDLFAIETYATVHHLVSTVTGQLAENYHAVDLLTSCFPGGSITGAPKIRAMQIIEELEPYRRGVYCGALGYISFDGNMDTNIAIRTLVHSHGSIRFWVGGGIVNDSVVTEEYQECFDKAAALLAVLQQF